MSDEWINLNDFGHLAEIEIFDPENTEIDEDYAALFNKPFEPIRVKFALTQPDPDLLALIGVNEPEQTFAVEVTHPIKRTFWQWLFRKPRQYGYVYVPHARLED